MPMFAADGAHDKFDRARSRLYRSQSLRVNMRWKALAKIRSRGIRLGKKIYENKHFSKLNFWFENR